MVLLSCLVLLSLLIALYYRFSREAALQVRLDRNILTNWQARLAAKGGLSFGLNLLFKDNHVVDHLDEDWYQVASRTWKEPVMLETGSFSVRIIDEAAKVNLNLADEKTLENLFERLNMGLVASAGLLGEGIRLGSARRLAQHVLDYRDEDDTPMAMGLEKDGYRLEGLPSPRNGPFQDVRELLNIPGVTLDMFQGGPGRLGLMDVLTVFGSGEINLNTALPEVIESIPGPPGYGEERRRRFFTELYRRRPFLQAGTFAAFTAEFDPWLDRTYKSRFVAFSLCFRVESVGAAAGVRKRLFALVRRDRFGVSRLDWIGEMP